MLMLTIVTTMAILVPGAAQAQIVGETVTWSGAVTTNEYDPYYDDTVLAYAEGATATVQFAYFNGSPQNMTVRPFMDMDWGTRYHGAAVNVGPFQACTLSIQFTVPTVAAAGGLIRHGYFIFVQAEPTGDPQQVNRAVMEYWSASGAATHNLGNSPVVGSSLQVWSGSGTGTGRVLVAPSTYTVNEWTGVVTFNAAPAALTDFWFTYNYFANVANGDGDAKAFMVAPPMNGEMKDGTLAVYLTNNVDNTVTLQTTGYTYDAKTWMLTFATAPTPNQSILVRFEYWATLPGGWSSSDDGRTFVIFSADQSAAITLWRRYMEISETEDVGGWASSAAQLLWSQAEAALAKGELEYREGLFAAASASMQTAVNDVNAAITTAVAFMAARQAIEVATDNATLTALLAENALIPKTGLAMDAQTAWNNAQTARMNALTEAEVGALKAANSREKSYGTFVILIGVFLILVGAAVLLLAVGMFLKWRKPAAGGST
jgi:hypothetical protein